MLDDLIEKFVFIVLIAAIAFEIGGDDYAHSLKNSALDSIQKDIENGEYKDKEAILEALKQIEDYNKGIGIENAHDLLGESPNPKEGFKDTTSGFLGAILSLLKLNFDWTPDRTIMDISKDINKGKEVKEDAKISINWGKVTPVNFVINYKQDMEGVLDFRRTVAYYIDPITGLDVREMGKKDPSYTDAIRILLPYSYSNYYANDPEKIIIEDKYEEKDGKIIIKSVVKVYQDSFSNISSPNKDADDTIQFGFNFKEDPRNTVEEYEKAFEDAMYAWRAEGLLNPDPDLVCTRTASKKANSYFASKNFWETNKDKFANYRNEILKAGEADAIQASFAFYVLKFHLDTLDNVKKTLQENNVDIVVVDDTEYQAYNCLFEDRDKEENKDKYKTVRTSEIDLPEELEKIPTIMYKLPLVLPKERYNKSTIMTATELDKAKRQVIDADTDLPKIKQGNDSKEEYDIYTVYDWESIREEEKGQASIKDKSPNNVASIKQEKKQSGDETKSLIDISTQKHRIEYDWSNNTVYVGRNIADEGRDEL